MGRAGYIVRIGLIGLAAILSFYVNKIYNDITSKKDIVKLMDKIIGTLCKPVLLNGQEFFISDSAGVALYPQDIKDQVLEE